MGAGLGSDSRLSRRSDAVPGHLSTAEEILLDFAWLPPETDPGPVPLIESNLFNCKYRGGTLDLRVV